MQVDQERLKNENTNLVAAFREKSRKHQQTQELYDRLKRKEMTAATQSAAYQSVDEVLGSVANSSGVGRAQGQGQQFLYHDNHNHTEQGYGHDRNDSNGSNGNTKDTMMPPPPRRPGGFGVPVLGSCPPTLYTRYDIVANPSPQPRKHSHLPSTVLAWGQSVSHLTASTTPITAVTTLCQAAHRTRPPHSASLSGLSAATASIGLILVGMG